MQRGGGDISRRYFTRMTIGATDPEWLQGAFSALVAIFDRVGLQTNVDKTVSMACQPCWAGSGNRTAEGYRRQITGEGKSVRERQRESGVRGVWGGNRGRIPVESLDDSTWEGRTTAAPLGPPDDWGAQDIQDKFPSGKPTAVPSGGMPGGV